MPAAGSSPNLPGREDALATPLREFLLSQTRFTSCAQNFLLREGKKKKHKKTDLESISGGKTSIVSGQREATVCEGHKTHRHVAPPRPGKHGSSRVTPPPRNTAFEMNCPPPEFLSLFASLFKDNQISFIFFLWPRDTRFPDQHLAMPTPLAWASAPEIQAPCPWAGRHPPPQSMEGELPLAVWNVVLGWDRPGGS